MNRIEEKYGLKPGHAYALFVILVLNVLWLIAMTIHLIQSPSIFSFTILSYIQFAFAAYYACYGYKKPHGNMMRYLLLFYAASLGLMLVMNAQFQGTLYNSTYVIVIILTAYMAGRLNKYKQNLIICLIVLVIKFINTYPYMSGLINYDGLSFVSFFSTIGPIVVWLAIAGAYLTRYKLHKEVGFEDKK